MAIYLNDNVRTNDIYRMPMLHVLDRENKPGLSDQVLRSDMTGCMTIYCNGEKLKEKKRPKSWLDILTVDIENNGFPNDVTYGEKKIGDLYSKSLPTFMDTNCKMFNSNIGMVENCWNGDKSYVNSLQKAVEVDNKRDPESTLMNNNETEVENISEDTTEISRTYNCDLITREVNENNHGQTLTVERVEKQNSLTTEEPKENINDDYFADTDTELEDDNDLWEESMDEQYLGGMKSTLDISVPIYPDVVKNIQKNISTFSHLEVMEDIHKNVSSICAKNGESKPQFYYKPLLKIANMEGCIENMKEPYQQPGSKALYSTDKSNAMISCPLTVDICDGSLKTGNITPLEIYKKEKEISEKLNSSSLPDITNIVKSNENLEEEIKESIAIYNNVRELKEQICCRSLPDIVTTENKDKTIKVKHLLQEISESMALYQNVKRLEEQLISISPPNAKGSRPNHARKKPNLKAFKNNQPQNPTLRTKSLPEIIYNGTHEEDLEEKQLRLQIRESMASYQRELQRDKDKEGQCCSKTLPDTSYFPPYDEYNDNPEFLDMSDDEWDLIDQVCYRSLLDVSQSNKCEEIVSKEGVTKDDFDDKVVSPVKRKRVEDDCRRSSIEINEEHEKLNDQHLYMNNETSANLLTHQNPMKEDLNSDILSDPTISNSPIKNVTEVRMNAEISAKSMELNSDESLSKDTTNINSKDEKINESELNGDENSQDSSGTDYENSCILPININKSDLNEDIQLQESTEEIHSSSPIKNSKVQKVNGEMLKNTIFYFNDSEPNIKTFEMTLSKTPDKSIPHVEIEHGKISKKVSMNFSGNVKKNFKITRKLRVSKSVENNKFLTSPRVIDTACPVKTASGNLSNGNIQECSSVNPAVIEKNEKDAFETSSEGTELCKHHLDSIKAYKEATLEYADLRLSPKQLRLDAQTSTSKSTSLRDRSNTRSKKDTDELDTSSERMSLNHSEDKSNDYTISTTQPPYKSHIDFVSERENKANNPDGVIVYLNSKRWHGQPRSMSLPEILTHRSIIVKDLHFSYGYLKQHSKSLSDITRKESSEIMVIFHHEKEQRNSRNYDKLSHNHNSKSEKSKSSEILVMLKNDAHLIKESPQISEPLHENVLKKNVTTKKINGNIFLNKTDRIYLHPIHIPPLSEIINMRTTKKSVPLLLSNNSQIPPLYMCSDDQKNISVKNTICNADVSENLITLTNNEQDENSKNIFQNQIEMEYLHCDEINQIEPFTTGEGVIQSPLKDGNNSIQMESVVDENSKIAHNNFDRTLDKPLDSFYGVESSSELCKVLPKPSYTNFRHLTVLEEETEIVEYKIVEEITEVYYDRKGKAVRNM